MTSSNAAEAAALIPGKVVLKPNFSGTDAWSCSGRVYRDERLATVPPDLFWESFPRMVRSCQQSLQIGFHRVRNERMLVRPEM